MAREFHKQHRKVASLVLELRLASPAQVAKALAAVEEGRGRDVAEWLERERILSAAQRALVHERLGLGQADDGPEPTRVEGPGAGAAGVRGEDTLIESSSPPRSAAVAARRPSPLVPPAPPPPPSSAQDSKLPLVPPGATVDGRMGTKSRAPSVAPRMAAGEEETGGDLLAIETAGRYTFVRVHASGGQARILLCRDEHVGRDIAIKEVHPGSAGQSEHGLRSTSVEAQRLLREARVTGQLEHPNIVPVYDLGRRRDGALYYSMRYVRGVTLSEKLRSCKTLKDRLRLLRPFMDICSAVAYAHSRGVIHRDLKPSNAMVGEFGETVLLDWGIAKVRGKRDIRAVEIANESKLMREYAVAETVDGAAIGTPAYMSPEQAAGKVDEIDERSDVYGLGAILYQILTGNPPNAGRTQAELYTAVLQGQIQPVLQACKEAPPELAAIAEKALRRDKNRRYRSAKDIADEVESYLTGGRVAAYRYTAWELLRRFAEQNKKTMAAAAAVLLIIVGALVAVSFAWRNASAAREKAERQEREARYNLARANLEKAEQQREDFRFVSAAGLAAESLVSNPAHPKGPFFSPEFAAGHPQARELVVRAASIVYQTRRQSLVELAATFNADEAPGNVVYSPDGSLVAAGSYDAKVRIWDVGRRELVKVLHGHQDRVYTVAWSPDGRILASAGRDRTIVLWDASDWSRLGTLEGHASLVRQVAFSPDSATLASASWDRTVRLWDVARGKVLEELPHGDQALAVAFSPDGKLLATGSNDRLVRVLRLPRLEEVSTIAAFTSEVRALAFSPDGRALATGTMDRAIRVFHPETARPLLTLDVSQGAGGIWALSYSPDGRYLASAGFDKMVRLWDARSGSPLASVEAHDGTVVGAAFSPHGNQLVSAGQDRLVKVWELRKSEGSVFGDSAIVYSVAFSPSGRRMASGSADKTIRLWDVASGQAAMTLAGHGAWIVRMAYSPDGSLLASAARERLVIVWDTQEGRALYKLDLPQDIYDVCFSPDGKHLATAGADKVVRVFEAGRGVLRHTFEGHEAALAAVAFSSDGTRLASGGQDMTIRVWDLATGKAALVLRGHKDWVWSVHYSVDGSRLLSAGKDGVAIIWDARTGAEIRRLTGHGEWVNRARFSPDGRLVVTGGDDRTARVWDAATGELRLIIHATHEVAGVDFSPDSRSIAVADGNSVRSYPTDFSLLEVEPQLLVEQAKAAGYRPSR